MSAPASGYTAIPISPPHDEDDDRTDHDAAAVAADRLDPPPAAAAAPADAADPNAAAPVDPNAPIPLTINNFLAFAEAAGSPDSQVVLAPRAGAVVNLLGTVRNTIVWIHWLAWYAVFAYMTFAHPRPQPELESGSCSRLAFIVHFWFVKMTISGVAFFFEKKHALVRTVSTVAIYVGFYYFWVAHFRLWSSAGEQCRIDDHAVWAVVWWRLTAVYLELLFVIVFSIGICIYALRHVEVIPGSDDPVLSEDQVQAFTSRVQNLTTFLYRPPTVRLGSTASLSSSTAAAAASGAGGADGADAATAATPLLNEPLLRQSASLAVGGGRGDEGDAASAASVAVVVHEEPEEVEEGEFEPEASVDDDDEKKQETSTSSSSSRERSRSLFTMGGTCAICVSDFEAGEMLKRLPCRHVFHSECIDPWLLGVARPMRKSTMHATCPLCKRDAIDLADIV